MIELTNYPPASQNNSREIIRGMIEKFKEKPSYGLSKKLEKLGIGVNWTMEYGEGQKPEDLYLMGEAEDFNLSDYELGELLK